MSKTKSNQITKKLFNLLIIGFLFVGIFINFSSIVLAANSVFCADGKCGLGVGIQETKKNLAGSGISTEDSAIKLIAGWTNFLLPFAGVLAILSIIVGGFMYITAFGNEEQTGKAKKIIMWSAFGLILIFSAYAIVNTLIKVGG